MKITEEHAVSITSAWTTKSLKTEATSPFEVASYSKRLQCAIITGLIQIPSVMRVLFGISLSWWWWWWWGGGGPIGDWYITVCTELVGQICELWNWEIDLGGFEPVSRPVLHTLQSVLCLLRLYICQQSTPTCPALRQSLYSLSYLGLRSDVAQLRETTEGIPGCDL
jgi:hypothetical protein